MIFFKPKLSWSCVKPCLSLALIYQWWFGYWQFILNRQSFPFVLRVCRTSFFFDFVIPVFCLNCFFCDYSQRDAPVFLKSPSHVLTYWAFILRDNDFLSLRLFGTITIFCFWKDFFGAIRCALGSTEKTTLPQVMIKGFNFFVKTKKTNSYFCGSKGLTRDYLPYNSSV